jgi:hypothetical protein
VFTYEQQASREDPIWLKKVEAFKMNVAAKKI